MTDRKDSEIPKSIRRVMTKKIDAIDKKGDDYDIEDVVSTVNQIANTLNKISGL